MHADEMVMTGAGLSVERMPAHWLMARLGKRVLRPGGREATRWLLERVRLDPTDDVVELAPGLGETARALLAQTPRSYVGVERDAEAARVTERALAGLRGVSARVVKADAARTGLGDASASVVVGEAMLSMQPARHKQAILAEAARVLRPGGRYLIHELAVFPDAIDREAHARLEKDLSRSISVGVRIGTPAQWREWLEAEGFVVDEVRLLPMRLLEPDRLIQDEGVRRTARFALNILRTPGALTRLRSVRATFHMHAHDLRAIAIVARRIAP
jgi:SAM-dependent methyltransferase